MLHPKGYRITSFYPKTQLSNKHPAMCACACNLARIICARAHMKCVHALHAGAASWSCSCACAPCDSWRSQCLSHSSRPLSSSRCAASITPLTKCSSMAARSASCPGFDLTTYDGRPLAGNESGVGSCNPPRRARSSHPGLFVRPPARSPRYISLHPGASTLREKDLRPLD